MKPIDKTSKIGWITHTYGPIDPKVYFNHLGCMLKWASQFNVVFLGIDKHRVADARNILVQSAKSLDCTHVIFIDADHIMPMHGLECLSKNNDAMIVSGLITKRKPPYYQVGFVRDGDAYQPINIPIDGRSYLVDVPAMGCTLIDMDVFDIVDEPYFIDTAGVKQNGGIYNKRSDTNFFEKCQEAKIKMIIDSRVLVGHMKDAEPVFPNCVPDTFELNKKDKIRNSAESLKHQSEVYEKAKLIALDNLNIKSVLDLGCGNPTKLIMKLGFVDKITGVDFQDKLIDIATEGNKLKGRCTRNWVGKDLNTEINLNLISDMVISADVIEHVQDPDTLIQTAKNHMHEDSIFIVSSPEKGTTNQDNPLHVREFTSEELLGVLIANGLSVIEQFSYQETNDISYTNNVFVCKLNKENKNGNSDTAKK